MLSYSFIFVFGLFGFVYCNKTAASSPVGIAINQATLGAEPAIAVDAMPYFAAVQVPEDIRTACEKLETPQQQFSRITDQKNDSIDFAQFLQLDACSTAWRRHDFSKIDTNNDSRISLDEWNAHNKKIQDQIDEAILNQRNYTFNRLDSNKDNLLGIRELRKYLQERMITTSNLTSYLNGSSLNFKQFCDFDASIPNATFQIIPLAPFYDYSAPSLAYGYYDDNEVVDPFIKPQPRPALVPPAIDVMPLPANSGPMILPAKGDVKIQIEPKVAVPQVLPAMNPNAPASGSTNNAAASASGSTGGMMSAAVMPH